MSLARLRVVHIMRPMRQNVTGKWRLVEMEQWDQEFVDLVEPGFIAFQKNGRGEMQFGAVNLDLDWEMGENDRIEFSFEGFDEGDEVMGRGWARLRDGKLLGQIKFHQGDKSGFTAESWKEFPNRIRGSPNGP